MQCTVVYDGVVQTNAERCVHGQQYLDEISPTPPCLLCVPALACGLPEIGSEKENLVGLGLL